MSVVSLHRRRWCCAPQCSARERVTSRPRARPAARSPPAARAVVRHCTAQTSLGRRGNWMNLKASFFAFGSKFVSSHVVKGAGLECSDRASNSSQRRDPKGGGTTCILCKRPGSRSPSARPQAMPPTHLRRRPSCPAVWAAVPPGCRYLLKT
jgi:hypothetical protein